VTLALLLAAAPVLWGGLDPGPHTIGFEQVEVFDYSRPFRLEGEHRARPITLSIWYPAESAPSGLRPLSFGRYVDGADGRESFQSMASSFGLTLSRSELEKLYGTETPALEKAPRASGSFPLLFVLDGLTGPFYLNTVLCEFLASHGYLVVAIPTLGVREDVEAEYDALSVDAQVRDMEFAIQELSEYPGIDRERMGLVAWSLGGVSQALLQMKNPDVRALVSLDAATGYAYGQKLLESSIFFDPRRATVPFFHATDSRESGQVPKSFRFYDEIAAKGRSYLLTIEGATHAGFTSLAAILPVQAAAAPSPEGLEQAERYRRLCLYVGRFLDAVLKNDRTAAEFLEDAPTRHGMTGLVLSRKR
jgi:dienelactone hydrolase